MSADDHHADGHHGPDPETRSAPAAPRRVTVLGATGSIGASTLDLLRRHPDSYEIEALTAGSNAEALAALAREFRPRFVAIAEPDAHAALAEALAGTGIEIAAGGDAVEAAARRPADWVMAAIVGIAGLKPVMAAIERGAVVALANKEALVCAGDLMREAARRSGARILPVDSEHNALFQAMEGHPRESIARLVLTASGGPFRGWSPAALAAVTPDQALAHPTWSMGAKVTIDSATLMNKGLELIEAHHLFDMPAERLDVLVHPQSVVHGLVEFIDGAVLAELGSPDMRRPIAHCLAWPGRMATPVARLDLAARGRLDFEPPDEARFPALALARHALQNGGATPSLVNGANEVAVAQFLAGALSFSGIADTVAEVLARAPARPVESLADVFEADRTARELARSLTGVRAASA